MRYSTSSLRFGGLIIAFALAGAAPVALADVATDLTESIAVHYDDLNLEADAGARMLVRRISVAAMEVCGGRNDLRMKIEVRERFDKCRAHAEQSAIAKVGHPRVTAVYAKKGSMDKRLASR